MAEIRVEPKRTSRAWIWVVLLLVLIAGVAYYLWATGMLGTTEPRTAPAGAEPAGTQPADTVRPVGSIAIPSMAQLAQGGNHGA